MSEVLVKKMDEMIELSRELNKQVEDVKKNAVSKEEFEGKGIELVGKMLAENERKREAENARLKLFPTGDFRGDPRASALKAAFSEPRGAMRDEKIVRAFQLPTDNKALEQLKDAHDELAIVSAVYSKRYGSSFKPESLKSYQRFVELRDVALKYMDTTDTANWVPVGMSANMIEVPQVLGDVPSLFEHIYCPTKTYDYPVYLNGPTVIGTQETENTAHVDPSSDPGAQAITDGKITFTAVKCRGRLVTSAELDEDSIIAMVPTIKRELSRIQARSEETLILNGHQNATHMDNDSRTTGDFRMAGNGLRYLALAITELKSNAMAGTFSLTHLRSIRGLLLAYGVNPRDLAWIVGPKTYINRLIGNDDVRTRDKYGDAATVFTGELGQLDGTPIVVSALQREDLNTSGVFDNSTKTNSTILLVNRNYWKVGDRNMFTIEAERLAAPDQFVFYGRRRFSFMPHMTPSATYTSVSIAYYFVA